MNEYHLIHVENSKGAHTYELNAATISLGRDSSDAVMIDDPLASRHHAMLLRMPSTTTQYCYQLIDGDVKGRRSRNGIWVNQLPCERKILETGDRIHIGSTRISYLVASMTPEEYEQHFETQPIDFHRLKQEVEDPNTTMVIQQKISA